MISRAAPTGAEAIYRKLFDSFDRDKDGKISHWEVLRGLQRSGLLPTIHAFSTR